MSRVRKIIIAASIVVGLVGLGFILFPIVQQQLYVWESSRVIAEFDERRMTLQEDSCLDLQALCEAMRAYNCDLVENGQAGFHDAWSYQEPSFDLTEWGLPDNVDGYIDIPAMGTRLPIYLGASDANMARGAVHLSQTSLPIGGESVNSVIAAHRGTWSGVEMFLKIDLLAVGDKLTITNLWETLTYRVEETKVILPTDTDEVLIQEGRDMVTLISCHPYGSNAYRYAVYCVRAE